MTVREALQRIATPNRAVRPTGDDARSMAAFAREALEQQSLSISFSGEASEAFADWINEHANREWYVRLTPQGGDPFDAILIGSAQDEIDSDGNGWYDAVRYLDADETTGLALAGASIKSVRVVDVHVY